MNRIAGAALFCAAVCLSSSQTAAGPRGGGSTIWTPQPLLKFDNVLPEPTVPKPMITSLHVSGVSVSLEHTELETMHARFGGKIGSKGDAADSLGWLCLHGNDATGAWVLWLESGEMDGPNIGAFHWRRVAANAEFDQRCQALPDSSSSVDLPINLGLGTPEADVVRLLGRPTSRKDGTLLYEHEHEESLPGAPYRSLNLVIVVVRKGVVCAIEVHQTTMS
jgi:hypothetical protein